jgi:hypothetical protein
MLAPVGTPEGARGEGGDKAEHAARCSEGLGLVDKQTNRRIALFFTGAPFFPLLTLPTRGI